MSSNLSEGKDFRSCAKRDPPPAELLGLCAAIAQLESACHEQIEAIALLHCLFGGTSVLDYFEDLILYSTSEFQRFTVHCLAFAGKG